VSLAREEAFAAIVMDIRLPGLDGYAAASFIRQHSRSASTPILFFSGDDIDVAYLTRQYGNTGQVDSLRKPFDPDVFRAKVCGWLDLYRREQHVHQLEDAVDAAQAQARSKDDILAMVAHDLRGPLGAIKMSVTSVRRQLASGVDGSKSRESLQRHLDLTDRTIDRMTRLVADLLDSVRIESTGLPLEIGTHAIDEIVAQAIELLSPLAEQKNVVLRMSPYGASGLLRCDRDRILQVLSNLLGNAVNSHRRTEGFGSKRRAPKANSKCACETRGRGSLRTRLPIFSTSTGEGIPERAAKVSGSDSRSPRKSF